jgi:uncharacterized protein YneF (UPF0154 family)
MNEISILLLMILCYLLGAFVTIIAIREWLKKELKKHNERLL